MRTPRCFLGGAATADGRLWALGGGSSLWQGAACYASTEFLDPALSPGASGGRHHGTGGSSGGASLPNRTLSAHLSNHTPFNEGSCGDRSDGSEGWETEDEDTDEDEGTLEWRVGPPMIHARCGLGAATDFERLYACGGYGGGAIYHKTCEVA